MHYTITPTAPKAHLFKVTLDIPTPSNDGQVVSLPSWIPGSYMIRDFAKNVVSINAFSGERQVPLVKLDKSAWQAGVVTGALRLEYEVYAWDLSVRSAHLDTNHGYFNGTSVFLQVKGQEQSPCTVDIFPPQDGCGDDWRVATSMTPSGAELYGFGRYSAQSYDELIDHPVEMANFSLATFNVNDVPHDIVITGRHRADMGRLCKDLERICKEHAEMFGELPAMERYVFLVLAVGEGYGGLEHRASCSLICSRSDLPVTGREVVTDGYRTFLGLCSHEYFHTWNVKRIKPAGFLPYSLEAETYTRQLWAFEGITSYYDDLGLVRSGIISAEEYLELLGQTMTRVWRIPGRFRQSVAESSFDAWTKFYRQDENSPNAIISYYTKGSVIALLLDVKIQEATSGKRSLNDLMVKLWCEYGKPGIGVPEGRIETLASEVAGINLDNFFQSVLYGTEDPDVKSALEWLGVGVTFRSADSLLDKGGKRSNSNIDSQPALGIKAGLKDSDGIRVSNVINGSAAQVAGISAGDTLIAIDGIKVTGANFESVLDGYHVGDNILIHAFRRDELMEFNAEFEAPELDTVTLELLSDIDGGTLARRVEWLGVDKHKWDAPA